MSVLEAFLWWCWIGFLAVIFFVILSMIGIVLLPMALIALVAVLIV